MNPVHKVIFGNRHTAVADRLFHLGQGNLIDRPSFGKRRKRCTQISLPMPFFDIAAHDIARHRPRGIERQVGIFTVAAEASSIVEDLLHLHLRSLVGRRQTVRQFVGYRPYGSGRYHDNRNLYTGLHFRWGYKLVCSIILPLFNHPPFQDTRTSSRPVAPLPFSTGHHLQITLMSVPQRGPKQVPYRCEAV